MKLTVIHEVTNRMFWYDRIELKPGKEQNFSFLN